MELDTGPTNFRDSDLLTQTLSEFGLAPSRAADGTVTCRAEGSTLVFRRDGDEVFHVEVRNPPDSRQIMEHLSDMDECYGRAVQARTYEKLKDRIAERGLGVEEEQVLEDDSIVLTRVINRQG